MHSSLTSVRRFDISGKMLVLNKDQEIKKKKKTKNCRTKYS